MKTRTPVTERNSVLVAGEFNDYDFLKEIGTCTNVLFQY